MRLLHVVRRYGPAGGMERYVWNLTAELAAKGHDVTILCERLKADAPPANVTCIELGDIAARPRWLAHLRFSRRVSRWTAAHPDEARTIHSHERTAVHHITTFHGPPFARVRDREWWRRASLRAQISLWLERREVCGQQVRAVVPNAELIGNMLTRFYPCIGTRLTDPITPGVRTGRQHPGRRVPIDGGVIGFVGKEWKRKGLDIAIRIIEQLRQTRPRIEFRVAGPQPQEIEPLFAQWSGGYHLLGEVDTADIYAGLDLLLHPARSEPYGMVITEAMAAKVPVLVSDQCGAAGDVRPAHGTVMALATPATAWAEAAHTLLARDESPPGYEHPWCDVAEAYVRCYRRFGAAAVAADEPDTDQG